MPGNWAKGRGHDCPPRIIDAANRAGPNPQVIEKDLVLGCLIAERPMSPAHPVTNTVLPSNFMSIERGYAENELNTDIRYSP